MAQADSLCYEDAQGTNSLLCYKEFQWHRLTAYATRMHRLTAYATKCVLVEDRMPMMRPSPASEPLFRVQGYLLYRFSFLCFIGIVAVSEIFGFTDTE